MLQHRLDDIHRRLHRFGSRHHVWKKDGAQRELLSHVIHTGNKSLIDGFERRYAKNEALLCQSRGGLRSTIDYALPHRAEGLFMDTAHCVTSQGDLIFS